MDVHEECSVRLRLLTQAIFTADDDQFLTDLSYSVDDFNGVQGGGSTQVDVEDLLCVPDQPVQVHWKYNLKGDTKLGENLKWVRV